MLMLKCDFCESTQNITTVNGRRACVKHINNVMNDTLKGIASSFKRIVLKNNLPRDATT